MRLWKNGRNARDIKYPRLSSGMTKKHGFTLVEMMVGSAVMLAVILAALSLYMRSNKAAVDQQQFAEVQQDVRSAMFFISRDVRSAGVGLSTDISGYFLEGTDSYSPGPENADALKILGNFDDPLELIIESYSGGAGGGSATAFLYDWSLENQPYECPGFYEDRMVMIISTTCPGCFTFRYIPQNSVFGCGSGQEHFNMEPGQSELNPPGGLVAPTCDASCWINAVVTLGQIRLFWVDTTGNPADYPELSATLTPDRGYLVDEAGNGIPNTLYMTTYDEGSASGLMVHFPLALNIENLQFQYNGDYIPGDGGALDGFIEWQPNWTGDLDIISRLSQVRMWVLGKTPNRFVSFTGTPPANLHIYRRPALANSLAGTDDDMHRRFVLESTVTIRNMSLNLYNTDSRE